MEGKHLNVSYDLEALKEMGREVFIASHPHIENAGEWYDTVVGKEAEPKKKKVV